MKVPTKNEISLLRLCCLRNEKLRKFYILTAFMNFALEISVLGSSSPIRLTLTKFKINSKSIQNQKWSVVFISIAYLCLPSGPTF